MLRQIDFSYSLNGRVQQRGGCVPRPLPQVVSRHPGQRRQAPRVMMRLSR
jgi:hypothetical protein